MENAPSIRKEQLHDYLSRRVGKAKLFLIAEACGYQGGHFTGIAMTCERMILNEHPAVNSLMILGKEGKRTSRKDSPMIAKPTQKEKGFNEPTDSVVWKACLDAGLSADEFILWNIYPFHPHKKDDLLSNRTPTDDELAIGLSYTRAPFPHRVPSPSCHWKEEREHAPGCRLLRQGTTPPGKWRRQHFQEPACRFLQEIRTSLQSRREVFHFLIIINGAE